MFAKLVTFFHPSRRFPVLVAYRWASLLPALFLLIDNTHTNSPNFLSPLSAVAIALLATAIITIFHRPLNKFVIEYPLAIGLDLLFVRPSWQGAVVIIARIIYMLSVHYWREHFLSSARCPRSIFYFHSSICPR